jgi:alkylhydroperoxidase family enzyme
MEMLERDAALAAAEEAGVPAALAELNVFRVLLRRPRLAKGLSQTLLALLGGDALDARRRELVIMRIAWVTGSGYEWSQHWRIARDLGVPGEDLMAVRDWSAGSFGKAAAFDETDRAVLAVTDAALAGAVPDAADLSEVREALGDDALIDLLAAVGTWSAVSLLLRALEVPLDPDLQPWPPDGRPSPAG